MIFRDCLLSATFFLFFSNNSLAQSNLNLVITDDPRSYVSRVLDDIESEGMSSVRDMFEGMGLNNPQTEAAISIYEGHENDSEERWTEIIGVAEAGNSLKQYYAYAFIGGGGWIYIRIDFNRRSKTEWVLTNFSFNSEYAGVIAPNFGFLK